MVVNDFLSQNRAVLHESEERSVLGESSGCRVHAAVVLRHRGQGLGPPLREVSREARLRAWSLEN